MSTWGRGEGDAKRPVIRLTLAELDAILASIDLSVLSRQMPLSAACELMEKLRFQLRLAKARRKSRGSS